MSSELDCIELVELVTDYLEDRLPTTDRQRFEDHLTICEGCVANVEQMRATVRALNETNAESLSPEVSERILGLFKDWSDSERGDESP